MERGRERKEREGWKKGQKKEKKNSYSYPYSEPRFEWNEIRRGSVWRRSKRECQDKCEPIEMKDMCKYHKEFTAFMFTKINENENMYIYAKLF